MYKNWTDQMRIRYNMGKKQLMRESDLKEVVQSARNPDEQISVDSRKIRQELSKIDYILMHPGSTDVQLRFDSSKD